MTCPNCRKLLRRIERLKAQIEELRKLNLSLKKRLELYENPNVPSSQLKYPLRRRRNPGAGKRFPGRPKGHLGRTRLLPKPDIVIEPEWGNCDSCGAGLDEPSFVRHHVVEDISNPSPKLVIDYLEFEGECRRCGSYNSSRHPDCPPDGRFGKNVYVQTTLMKFKDRMPFEKVREALERTYGLTISTATVLELTKRVSDWLRPEYEVILERVRAAPVVYVDETGEKEDGKKRWLWAFVTSTETLAVIRKSRGKKVLEEILGRDFSGYLVVDGWRSYPTFTTKIQRDWAHMLREAEWLSERLDEAKPLHKALMKLFNQLKATLEDDPPPDGRRKLALAAKRRMRYWLKKRYSSEEIRRFIKKVQNGFKYWFTFIEVPGMEPTNNRAELALREHVVQRKIIGTFRNEKGIKIYEIITTMLATWKQRGLDPAKMLNESLAKAWNS